MLTAIATAITGIASIVGGILYIIKRLTPTQADNDAAIDAASQSAEDAFKKTGAPK